MGGTWRFGPAWGFGGGFFIAAALAMSIASLVLVLQQQTVNSNQDDLLFWSVPDVGEVSNMRSHRSSDGVVQRLEGDFLNLIAPTNGDEINGLLFEKHDDLTAGIFFKNVTSGEIDSGMVAEQIDGNPTISFIAVTTVDDEDAVRSHSRTSHHTSHGRSSHSKHASHDERRRERQERRQRSSKHSSRRNNYANDNGDDEEDNRRTNRASTATEEVLMVLMLSGGNTSFCGINKAIPASALDVVGDVTVDGSLVLGDYTFAPATAAAARIYTVPDVLHASHVQLGISVVHTGITTTATGILTFADSGKIIPIVSAAVAVTIALPVATACFGCEFRFHVRDDTPTAAITITTGASASASMVGTITSASATAANNVGVIMTAVKSNFIIGTSAAMGDHGVFYCDGVNWIVNWVTQVPGSVTVNAS